MPTRRRSCNGSSAAMGSPRNVTRPDTGTTSRLQRRSNVDFPEPEGPTRTVTPADGTVASMRSTRGRSIPETVTASKENSVVESPSEPMAHLRRWFVSRCSLGVAAGRGQTRDLRPPTYGPMIELADAGASAGEGRSDLHCLSCRLRERVGHRHGDLLLRLVHVEADRVGLRTERQAERAGRVDDDVGARVLVAEAATGLGPLHEAVEVV